MAETTPSAFEMSLRDYTRILKKRKFAIGFVTLLVFGSTFAISSLNRPVPTYEASTRVKFEHKSPAAALLLESMNPWYQDEIASQQEVIKAFPVLEKAAVRLGMLKAGRSEASSDIRRQRLRTLVDLQGRIEVERQGGTNVIQITARGSDRMRVLQLANEVSRAYAEYNKELRGAQAIAEQAFAEEQMQRVQKEMDASESKLDEYRKTWKIVSIPQEIALRLQEIARYEGDLEANYRSKNFYASLLQELERSGALPLSSLDPLSNAGLFTLDKALVDLRRDRSDLLLYATNEHPRFLELDSQIRTLQAQIKEDIERRLAQVDKERQSTEGRLDSLRKEYGKIPERELEFQRLTHRYDRLRNRYEKFSDSHQDARTRAAAMLPEVEILQEAVDASEMNPAKTQVHALLGAVFGFLLGILWALVRESLDTSMGTIEEVEGYVGLSILGVIPDAQPHRLRAGETDNMPPGLDHRVSVRLSGLLHPDDEPMESFRSLRNHLLLALQNIHAKVFQVSSATLREGKTAVAINLALTFAQAGKRILLVDADFRRPTVHATFGLSRSPGLYEVLSGRATLASARRTVADLMLGPIGPDLISKRSWMDRVHILTCGGSSQTISEALGTAAVVGFFQEAKAAYDYILVDSPPVLAVADAILLGTKVEGTLLVYEVGRTPRMALRRAKLVLERAKAPLLGIVLNRVRANLTSEDYYSYYPLYRADKEPEPTKK